MATTFHKFPQLKPELRLMIWREALLGARDTRVVILHNDRVVPLDNLVSPLLSVNYEARASARAFYTARLGVLVVPRPGVDPELLLGRVQELAGALGLGVSGTTYASFVRRLLRDKVAPEAVREAEGAQFRMGEVYVSPEHDVLVSGYDCGLNFLMRTKWDILGQAEPPIEDISWSYTTTRLPPAACQQASSLIRLTVTPPDLPPSDPSMPHILPRLQIEFDFQPDGTPQPVEYGKEEADRLWQADLFPNLRDHYTLPLGIEEYDSFLLDIIMSEGRLPRDTERWVWYTGEYSQGKPVLVNEQEWTRKLEQEKLEQGSLEREDLEAEGSGAQG